MPSAMGHEKASCWKAQSDNRKCVQVAVDKERGKELEANHRNIVKDQRGGGGEGSKKG